MDWRTVRFPRFLTFTLTLLWTVAPALASSEKTKLCHVPGTDPGRARELMVSEAVLQRHLERHAGDHVGSCAPVPPGETEEPSPSPASPKVTLCHVPPGNPGAAREILIGDAALAGHLRNHSCDYVGACEAYFPNGVAAGDADQSSVMLWARAASPGTIRFEYGRDPRFSSPPDGSQTKVVLDPAIPAKLDVSDLAAGSQYYYRACRGETCWDACPAALSLGSEVRGQFRTPFAGGHHGLRFGVSSCSAYGEKPFVALRNLPHRDLDFFVALGDTVYADSTNEIDGKRQSAATTLEEFRIKHEQGYSQVDSPDDNFMALARASTAFYVDIDDHEVVNDFAGGAPPESTSQTEACTGRGVCFCPDDDPNGNCDRDFVNETDIFDAALQAWYEYNPVREEEYGNTQDPRTAKKARLYRYRTFGKDAAVIMLDTRSFRDQPLELFDQPYATLPVQAYDNSRTMLGSKQLRDLLLDLKDAEARGITWKFVLVPEPIQNLGYILASDRFESYAFERSVILDYIQSFCIPNVVFVSGDIHGTIANNLIYRKGPLAPERYSATWDISTGPMGYPVPYGQSILSLLDTLLEACAGNAACESLLPANLPEDGFESLPPDEQNAVVEALMNRMFDILRYPQVGLDDEDVYATFLQKENAHVPATLLEGTYLATSSFGWAELEIDDVTRNLTVTTYGTDPGGAGVGPVPVVSKFVVAPAGRANNGAACSHDIDCASCRCKLSLLGGGELLECAERKPNGSLCLVDGECGSGRCSGIGVLAPGVQECQPKAPNGGDCLFDSDCLLGNCSGLLCRRSPNGSSCGDDGESLCTCIFDDDCFSGNCSLGVCRAKE